MSILTFKGGIHPYEGKELSKAHAIKKLLPEGDVVIPLSQHIGAPATPLVKKGDSVCVGQIIGRFDNGLSCPVHASVSGTVKDIEMRNSYTGYGKTAHVIIENDFLDTVADTVGETIPPPEELYPDGETVGAAVGAAVGNTDGVECGEIDGVSILGCVVGFAGERVVGFTLG